MSDNFSIFNMPEKVVTRLLKDVLPDNVQISKDAKNAACRSAAIFILQLSILSAEKAEENRRSNIENQDIIKAVTDLGLGEYAPQLVRFGAQRKRSAKRKESNTAKPRASKKMTHDDPSEFSLEQDPDLDQDHEQDQDEGNEHDLEVDQKPAKLNDELEFSGQKSEGEAEDNVDTFKDHDVSDNNDLEFHDAESHDHDHPSSD